MNANRKEKRFLTELENMFTGAKVDGDSGFVNLMRMKHDYFQSIRPKLMTEIDRRAEKDSSFREELFDKLYTFFHRYFCESGSIYFRHLPAFSKTYERVYADGQDVALSWKTQMLYYVKSDILVQSIPVELSEQGQPQNTRRFYFDASEFESKKNNERREFIFSFSEVKRTDEGKVVHLKVSYSHGAKKTKRDEIIKESRKSGIILSDEQLQKAISVFRRQTEVDFFINKDARGFLQEQFDMWVYQYIFKEETIFEEKRIKQIQAIKETAYCIIDFIAQFEDELRRAWEKPKFVRNVNYVITLNKLTDTTLEKLLKHKDTPAQIKEWRELGMVHEKFSMKDVFNGQKSVTDKNGASGNCQFLPLDTKHFKDLELEILDGLGNLDEALDGELVHSENWQALNSLQRRYEGRVKCIHIDPPYNTKTSGFLYRNDYKHSSWLTMMENRVSCSLKMLSEDSSFFCHIDENEYEKLHLLMDNTGLLNAGTLIWDKRTPMTGGKGIANQHEYVICRLKNEKTVELKSMNAGIMFKKSKQLVKKHRGVTEEAKKSYANWVRNHRKLSGGEQAYCFLDGEGFIYRLVSLRAPEPRIDQKFFKPLVHPVTGKLCAVPPNGFSRTPETLQMMIEKGEIIFGSDETTQPQQKRFLVEYSKNQLTSVMQDAKRGKADLDKLGGKNFPYSHSVFFYMSLTSAGTETASGVVLDYFAGSGTTAHAVINLNREDGGNRKYLLVEMGEYFYTVLLPRIKKVVYSKDWKDGKPVSHEGSSHCLKYYTLEQYEETLKNAHYQDGIQLELDSEKSPFAQYIFFGDDKLAHAVKPLKNGNLKIDLHNLYPDINIAESLSNILGKPIRKHTADSVIFADGTVEKTNPKTMTEKEKRHFISLIKPYLWWGE